MLNSYVSLLIVSCIFSFATVLIKFLHLPPTTFTFFRMGVQAIITLSYLMYTKKKVFVGVNKTMYIASLLNAARMFFYFAGFTYATLGNASIASATEPIFMFIFGALILKERISKSKLFYCV